MGHNLVRWMWQKPPTQDRRSNRQNMLHFWKVVFIQSSKHQDVPAVLSRRDCGERQSFQIDNLVSSKIFSCVGHSPTSQFFGHCIISGPGCCDVALCSSSLGSRTRPSPRRKFTNPHEPEAEVAVVPPSGHRFRDGAVTATSLPIAFNSTTWAVRSALCIAIQCSSCFDFGLN